MKRTTATRNPTPVQSVKEDRYLRRTAFDQYSQVVLSGKLENGQPVSLLISNLSANGALGSSSLALYNESLEKGTRIQDLTLYFNKKKLGEFSKAVVVHKSEKKDQFYFGLRFETNQLTIVDPRSDRREFKRHSFQSTFSPELQCKNPVDLNDTLYFRAINIHLGGALLETSARNSLLFEGMVLENVSIKFPSLGKHKLSFKVCHIHNKYNGNQVILGIHFINVTEAFKEDLVRFLISFADDRDKDLIDSLRQSGLKIKKLKSHVRYQLVQTLEEYDAVLKLRQKAYDRHQKINSEGTSGDMSDIYDLASKIYIAKVGNKVIGSVRVTFQQDPFYGFELEESMDLPAWIPKSQAFEVSRLCVHDDYEGTDVVVGLIEQTVIQCLKMDIKYAITSCTDDRVKYYKKMGFRPVGKRFHLKTVHAIPHTFLVLDIRTPVRSFGLNPLYWYFIYRRPKEFLQSLGYLSDQNLNLFQKTFLKMQLALLSVLQKLTKR